MALPIVARRFTIGASTAFFLLAALYQFKILFSLPSVLNEYPDAPLILAKVNPDNSTSMLLVDNPYALRDENTSVREGKSRSSRYDKFVVDIFMTGSLTRPDYMETAKRTWASHVSVRNFWTVTEAEDPHPECQNMTMEQVLKTSRFCRSRRPASQIARHFRAHFALPQWIQQKTNPTGWLCAQARTPYGLARAIQRYTSPSMIPDYLIVIDDDSYVNLEWFEQLQSHTDSEIPVVYAGCMIRSPIHSINWTLPFGGWGMFYSGGAIQRMLQPLRCSNATALRGDHFERDACRRVNNNLIMERNLWKPGMSVNDLMAAVSQRQPFCLHSDWATAYFVNYYFISNHVDEAGYFGDVEQSRLHMLENSELYGHIRLEGNCRNFGAQHDMKRKDILCNKDSHICHYVTPDEMRNVSQAVISEFPEKYLQAAPGP